MKAERLARWIRTCLVDPDKEGKKVSAFSVVHMIGMAPKEIHTLKLGAKQWTDMDIAKILLERASEYVFDLKGVHTFQILAFWDGSTEPGAHQPFVINNLNENSEVGLLTENPTDQGQRQQGMRHVEVMAQMYMRGASNLIDQQRMALERADRRISALEDENRDAFLIVKDMIQRSVDIDHEKKMKELEYRRSSEERKLLMKYVPALVNTALGREVFPQNVEDTTILEGMMEKLSDEEIKILTMKFGNDPVLMGPLISRIDRFRKKQEEEKKQEAENTKLALVAHTTPEEDLH